VTPGKAVEGTSADGISGSSLSNKSLFVHDSLAFLFLFLITVALCVATSFLFRSFSNRRQELAKQYSYLGQQALRENDPEGAIIALRTGLEYSEGGRDEQLLLAEALAEGHHTDEAIDYFLNLHETEPASGSANLELARLYREKGNSSKAIDFYRSASLGNWDSNGIEQRLQTELELSQYMIERGDLGSARVELLMAEQNVPESSTTEIVLGDMLLQANDPAAALASYEKFIKRTPHNLEALSKAGRILYDMGRYAEARRMLDLALNERPAAKQAQQLSELSSNAAKLLHLSLSRELPADEHAQHIRADATIAKHRLDFCAATSNAAALPPSLQELKSRWRNFTMGSAADEDAATQLIFDTETTTSQLCGAPTGDDALLLVLSKMPSENPQEKR
jgi:Tfp pilus assembly protein PilF